MRVERLAFSGFRNLCDGQYAPCPGVNILCGLNAQGKTNLLEALWLCTGAKSFRGAKDAEFIRFGETRARLSLFFSARGRRQTIDLTVGEGRAASLGGVSLESPARLSGEFCAVIFSPEHLGLVKEGPELRRRFLDAAICPLSPRHATAVHDYKKSLAQRNALLRDIPRHSELIETLPVWDEALCAAGAQIVYTRLRYLTRLSQKAAAVYGGISKNGETLDLAYTDPAGGTYEAPLSDRRASLAVLFKKLAADMKAARGADIETGYTHAGPHRDDLLLTINGISARTFGSQGQQRSAVLALKLAEAAVLSDSVGEPPVLLLDDVMSELDPTRQDYLLNHIAGMQVFITCCDPSFRKALGEGLVTEISAGRLSDMP